MKKLKKLLIAVGVLLVISIVGMAFYLGDYYHADKDALLSYSTKEFSDISVVTEDNYITYGDSNADTAFIFYPGGKVEYTAYEPLLKSIANSSEDIFCILVKMPGNLAIFDVDAAEEIQNKYSNVENWYIGGHSLGGAAASMYLENNFNDYDGLVLLGSYSSSDLSDTNLDVLSIYGSEDLVLNGEKYLQCKANLPVYQEYVIDGGCHSYFGTYGEQERDGIPSISNDKQIEITTKKIVKFIG